MLDKKDGEGSQEKKSSESKKGKVKKEIARKSGQEKVERARGEWKQKTLEGTWAETGFTRRRTWGIAEHAGRKRCAKMGKIWGTTWMKPRNARDWRFTRANGERRRSWTEIEIAKGTK